MAPATRDHRDATVHIHGGFHQRNQSDSVRAPAGDSSITGALTLNTLTKTGPGRLLIGSSGITTSGSVSSVLVSTGILQMKANPASVANAIGTATVTLAGGTALQVRANSSFNFGNSLILTGSATVNADRINGATDNQVLTLGSLTLGAVTMTAGAASVFHFGLEFSGNTTLLGNATITANTAGQDLAIDGAVTGAFTLTKNGSSVITFAGGGSVSAASLGGPVNFTGSSFTAGSMTIPSGTTNLSGGKLLTTQNTSIGVNGGTDVFTQSGGVFATGGEFDLATNIGSSGTFDLTAGMFLTAANAYVGVTSSGSGGTGVMNISGGSATISGTLKVWDTGGTALNLSGGTLSVGTLDLSGNSSRFHQTGGVFILLGGGSGDFIVGDTGTESYEQSAGSLAVTGDMVLGNTVTGNGTFLLDNNAGLAVSGIVHVGSAGVGVFNQVNGTHVIGTQAVHGGLNVAAKHWARAEPTT